MAMNVSEPTVSEQIEKLYKRLEDVYKQQETYGLYIKQKFELMQSVIDQQEIQIAELTRQRNADCLFFAEQQEYVRQICHEEVQCDDVKIFIQSTVDHMIEQQLEDHDTRLFNLEQYHDICPDSDSE